MIKNLTLALALFATCSIYTEELVIPSVEVAKPSEHDLVSSTQRVVFQEPTVSTRETFQIIESPKQIINKKGSIYVRALTDAEPSKSRGVFPGLGIGYRTSFNNSGIDISASVSTGEGQHRTHYFWTAPKVSYLHYVSSGADHSLYAGAGLAWGGISSAFVRGVQDTHFRGLIPHVTVGYEFLRNSLIFSFTEFTLSQPLFTSTLQGAKPGIVGELSIGAGF